MTSNALKIIAVDPSRRLSPARRGHRLTERKRRDAIARATFERAWLRKPEQFNPTALIDQERVLRTWKQIEPYAKKDFKVADLGFGWGMLTERLALIGCHVDAVDIAYNAIRRLKQQTRTSIKFHQAALPFTNLPSHCYDLVICTDVVADLVPHDQRLLVSEIHHLLKPDGVSVISSALNFRSEGPLPHFLRLLTTELEIQTVSISHHAYWHKLQRYIHPPAWVMARLEALCALFSQERGASHVIAVTRPAKLT